MELSGKSPTASSAGRTFWRQCFWIYWWWNPDASSRKEDCANWVAAGHLLSVIAGIRPLHGIHFIILSAPPLASQVKSPYPSQYIATLFEKTTLACWFARQVQMLRWGKLAWFSGLLSRWNSKTRLQHTATSLQSWSSSEAVHHLATNVALPTASSAAECNPCWIGFLYQHPCSLSFQPCCYYGVSTKCTFTACLSTDGSHSRLALVQICSCAGALAGTYLLGRHSLQGASLQHASQAYHVWVFVLFWKFMRKSSRNVSHVQRGNRGLLHRKDFMGPTS